MQRQSSTGRRSNRGGRSSFPRGRATTLRTRGRRGTTPARSRSASKSSARGGTAQRSRSRLAGKTTSRRTGIRRQPLNRGMTPKRAGGARSRFTQQQGGRTGQSAKTTTDHETIRRWAEDRGGVPATVTRTARGREAGILRIDFPGFSGEGTLNEIDWEEWFYKFDQNNLAFLYQDKTVGGQQSRFFKLVNRSQSPKRRR